MPAESPSADLLEQRVNAGGGGGGGGDMVDQRVLALKQTSKYVRAALPAAAVLGFPVAAFVDVELLAGDAVLAALEPAGLVAVVGHACEEERALAWKKRSESSRSLQEESQVARVPSLEQRVRIQDCLESPGGTEA